MMGRRADMTAEQKHADNIRRRERRRKATRAQMARLDRGAVVHRADGESELVLERGDERLTLQPGPGRWRRDLLRYHEQTPYIVGLTAVAEQWGWRMIGV